MEELKVSYSFDYLKEVFNYILVPVFVVLLIVVVGLVIYSKKEKDHTTEKYQYTINFWSYLMCIILSAALFAIALSFVVSLHKSIAGRPVDKTNLIYIVYLSPLIPLLFLISTGFRWIKMFLAYKESRKDDDSDDEDDSQLEDEADNENEVEENIVNDGDNDVVEVEDVPLEKDVVPIPVTLNNESSEEVKSDEDSPIPVVVEEIPSTPSVDEEKKDVPKVEEPVVNIENDTENNIDVQPEEKEEKLEDIDESKDDDIEVLDID